MNIDHTGWAPTLRISPDDDLNELCRYALENEYKQFGEIVFELDDGSEISLAAEQNHSVGFRLRED